MYLYADDAKLFSNNVDNLQSALERLSAWLYSSQLNLTPAKCEHLHISRFSDSLDQSFQVCSHKINNSRNCQRSWCFYLLYIILNGLNISITLTQQPLCVFIRYSELFFQKRLDST